MRKHYFKILDDTDMAAVVAGEKEDISIENEPPILTVDESVRSSYLPKYKDTLEPIINN